jgi:uncharacterized membrane protein
VTSTKEISTTLSRACLFLTASIDVSRFIDPVAVRAHYWVWLKPGSVYYGIPLLNYVGWFVLMLLAPLGWILIARKREWHLAPKLVMAFAMLIPLILASIVLSLVLNGLIAALGIH